MIAPDPSLTALASAAARAGWELADVWGPSRVADLVAFRRATARFLVGERGWTKVRVARLLRRHSTTVDHYMAADNRQAFADWREDMPIMRRAFP